MFFLVDNQYIEYNYEQIFLNNINYTINLAAKFNVSLNVCARLNCGETHSKQV